MKRIWGNACVLALLASPAAAQSVITTNPDPAHPILSQAFQDETDLEAGSPLTGGNRLELLQNGAVSFPRKLDLIRSAVSSVFATTMVAVLDDTGEEFVQELIAARARGVDVRCVLDGRLSDPRFINALIDGGVEVLRFNTVTNTTRGGFLHKKIVVADLDRAITGGMNMADPYNLGNGHDDLYLDNDIYVEGDVALELTRAFLLLWLSIEPGNQTVEDQLVQANALAPTQVPPAGLVGLARYLLQESDLGRYTVRDYYTRCFEAARTQIVWHVASMMPADPHLAALQAAAARGVRVVLITPSQRAEIDRYGWLVGWSRYWGLRLAYRKPRLEGSGIQVYEMDAAIHSKVVTVDGVMAGIGSYNLSSLSERNLENSVVVYDPTLVREVEDMFERHLTRSTPTPY